MPAGAPRAPGGGARHDAAPRSALPRGAREGGAVPRGPRPGRGRRPALAARRRQRRHARLGGGSLGRQHAARAAGDGPRGPRGDRAAREAPPPQGDRPAARHGHRLHRRLPRRLPDGVPRAAAIHETVLGEDLLAGLEVGRADLRHQCEREVRSRLVGLRQGYLRSLGEPKALAEALARFLAGYQPLARGVLTLLGREVPVRRAEVFAALAAAAGPDAGVFAEMLAVREGRSVPDATAVRALFERCHRATEQLGRVVDALAG